VIEGGASRAAYASGAALALQDAGVVPDAVYGTSAGGAIAAWFAAGQAQVGIRTWDRLSDRSLLSFRRLAGGRATEPVLDFRRLYAQYYPTVFAMDVAALRRARFPVVVTLADVETATTRYADLRHVADPWRHLHATSAMPLVSESPVWIDGRAYVDGGITDPIPLQRAIDDGHRDIIVVLNGPDVERGPENAMSQRLVARRFPALREALARRHLVHNATVRLAKAPPEGVRVRIVRPKEALGISRTSRDLAVIERAIARGRADGEALVKTL